jgi:hypothetical protein
MSDLACEVPLVEQLRSIPKDYRAVLAIQWADDGRETGHQYIPVGFMMHRAADEIERLGRTTGPKQSPETQSSEIDALPAWVKEELKDGDRLCEAAGVQRTEGGRLPVAKIINQMGRPVPAHRSGGARGADAPRPEHASLDDKQWRELEALEAKATPGPWEADGAVDVDGRTTRAIYHRPKWNHIVEVIESPDADSDQECIHNAADQPFIVALRNAWPQIKAALSAQSAITPADRDAIIEECARVAYNARLDGAPVEYAIRMLKKFPCPVSPEGGASE